MKPRVWLVTARDIKGEFIDQRRLEAWMQEVAESDARDWIRAKGGSLAKSTISEIDK